MCCDGHTGCEELGNGPYLVLEGTAGKRHLPLSDAPYHAYFHTHLTHLTHFPRLKARDRTGSSQTYCDGEVQYLTLVCPQCNYSTSDSRNGPPHPCYLSYAPSYPLLAFLASPTAHPDPLHL
jgi:hypothetical protein